MTRAVAVAVVGLLLTAVLVIGGLARTNERPDRERPSEPTILRELAEASSTLETGDGRAGPADLEAEGLSETTIAMLDLDAASIEAIGSFALESGGRHEIYLAQNRSGQTCLIEERPLGRTPNGDPLGIYGGGCSPGALAPDELKISVSAAGDPDAPGTQGVSIVGVAGSDVRNVTVLLRNGNTLPVELTARNAFHYVVPTTAIGTDTSPLEFHAFDDRGRKVSEASLR